MAFLTKVSEFIEFQEIARYIIILTNSEMFGNDENNSPLYCFKKLQAIVVHNTVLCDIVKTQTEETAREHIENI